MGIANFGEDSKTTKWLERMGVKHEYRSGLRLTELGDTWNGVNQGRPDSEPRNELLVVKYKDAQANSGAVFPAPIIAMNADGFEVLDGLQRLIAYYENGQTLFNAYVVKTDNAAIRAGIRIGANSVLNGTSPSQDWTIAKAVDVLVEQFRWKLADVANWIGQPEKKIEVEIASRDMGRWLEINGVDTKIKPANQKGFLAHLAKKVPFKDRIQLSQEIPLVVWKLQEAKSNNDEATHFVDEIFDLGNTKGSSMGRLVRANLARVMERPEIKTRLSSKKTMHPVDNCIRSLATAITVFRSTAQAGQHSDDTQSARINEMLAEIEKLSRKVIPKPQWRELVLASE